MAVDYLNALNVGSGLQTNDIIDALVEAERAPKESAITTAKDKRTVEISGLGQIKSGFEKMDTSLSVVEEVTGLSVASSGTGMDIEISDATIATNFSHAMNVSTVAATHTLVFGTYSSETASVGTGSLDFSFGTWAANGTFSPNSARTDTTVTLATGSGTLADLRDAINNADMQVTASILKTSDTSYSLVLQSREGAAHAMQITATEDSGATGLSSFAYTSVDANTETITAADASFTMDGVTITRDSNTITDLIDGVTLTVKSTTSAAETISGTYNTATAKAAMQIMVDQINTISTTLKDLSKRGSGSTDDGPLAGDPYVMMLRRQLRNFTTTAITGFQDSSIYLTDFGVKTERDGTLKLDTTKFEKTFTANPDAFAALTTSRITSGSSLVIPTVAGTYPKPGVYAFDISDDATATLGGTAMTNSGSDYTVSNHDAGGLKLTITSGGADTNIFVGQSLFETLDSFAATVLASSGDLQTKITSYNADLLDYDDKLTRLDEQIESIRARHVADFAAMNATVASLKETEKALDNMMESWKASLQG
jgi:flagellar hook-associated protein 2